MRRYDADGGIPTLDMALSEFMNTEDLKKLGALTGEKLPTRKLDLAQVIIRHLEGERLRALWQGLDQIDRAAVAEVVHSSSTQFPAYRFRAKYGQDPKWGSADEYRCGRNPSALCFFFYRDRIMPDDLQARLKAFVPPPAETKVQFLERLPSAYDRPFERWNEKKKEREHGTEPIPLTVRESERSAQRELLSILRLIDAGKVTVSEKTRRASAASVETITAVLEGGDYYPFVPPQNKWRDENAGPMRAFAWPLLIQAGGLAQLFGSKLHLTKPGRKALAEPAAHTLKTLWEKWTDTALFDELSRIERIYEGFRKGELRCIVLSRIGNFAIDLPDADLLIQVSGAFGSRQEEAQRLGRVLRPKADGRAARFFTLVSRDTREEEFAHHRKLFLTEQGYSYQVHIAEELRPEVTSKSSQNS